MFWGSVTIHIRQFFLENNKGEYYEELQYLKIGILDKVILLSFSSRLLYHEITVRSDATKGLTQIGNKYGG